MPRLPKSFAFLGPRLWVYGSTTTVLRAYIVQLLSGSIHDGSRGLCGLVHRLR